MFTVGLSCLDHLDDPALAHGHWPPRRASPASMTLTRIQRSSIASASTTEGVERLQKVRTTSTLGTVLSS